jgi:hypothetical protein
MAEFSNVSEIEGSKLALQSLLRQWIRYV